VIAAARGVTSAASDERHHSPRSSALEIDTSDTRTDGEGNCELDPTGERSTNSMPQIRLAFCRTSRAGQRALRACARALSRTRVSRVVLEPAWSSANIWCMLVERAHCLVRAGEWTIARAKRIITASREPNRIMPVGRREREREGKGMQIKKVK